MTDCPETPKVKFWLLEVGDDPGDETCLGPFLSFKEAFEKGSPYYAARSYWVRYGPTIHKTFIGFQGQISSQYIIWGPEEKPTYDDYVRPILLKGETL